MATRISGLDFQEKLSGLGIHLPVIPMTGHSDVPMSVRGMKAGAVDFLTKPFGDQDMLDAIAKAIGRAAT
jgi:FixJ family two-component response regulator